MKTYVGIKCNTIENHYFIVNKSVQLELNLCKLLNMHRKLIALPAILAYRVASQCGVKLKCVAKHVALVQVECIFSLFCCDKNTDSQTTAVR